MPIYEYSCQQCQTVSEHILMPSDPRPTKCPACGGKLHKRISAPAIQFKGSGWYVTDYAKRPAAETGNGAKAKPSEAAAAPAADKPAEKPDAAAPAPKEAPKAAKEAPAGKKES